jgi:hypothetical protein
MHALVYQGHSRWCSVGGELPVWRSTDRRHSDTAYRAAAELNRETFALHEALAADGVETTLRRPEWCTRSCQGTKRSLCETSRPRSRPDVSNWVTISSRATTPPPWIRPCAARSGPPISSPARAL